MNLPHLPRNVWIATLTSFLMDVSSEMIHNVLPLFLANVLGASTSTIGLIEGVADATSSLLKVVSGWVSDRFQSRKWLAVLGYGISACLKPFFYVAGSWLAVLGIRFADRVGKGIRTAPRDALIADSITPEQRGMAFGLHRAGDTAGAAVGLITALVIVLILQAQAAELSRQTFRWLVIASTIPAFLSVIALAWGAEDVPFHTLGSPPTLSLRGLKPEFKIFLLTVAIFTLGNSSDGFLILRAQERGLTVAGILGMLITFNVIYSAASTPLGRLSDHIGRKRLLIGGWLWYGMIYLGFALAQSAWHIWIVYGLYGLYYAAFEGTARAYIADLISPEQRGTAYGVFSATVGVMAFPASLLAGVLWQEIGVAAPFAAGAGLALAASGLLMFVGRKS
jgi:MFS family permease